MSKLLLYLSVRLVSDNRSTKILIICIYSCNNNNINLDKAAFKQHVISECTGALNICDGLNSDIKSCNGDIHSFTTSQSCGQSPQSHAVHQIRSGCLESFTLSKYWLMISQLVKRVVVEAPTHLSCCKYANMCCHPQKHNSSDHSPACGRSRSGKRSRTKPVE